METIWSAEINKQSKEFTGELKYDAVVIGGGLCGVLTAYHLSRSGLLTALIEAEQVGGGQSRGTTAKITLCHGDKLSKIEESFGTDSLMSYVRQEIKSIDSYEQIIAKEKIDCSFEKLPAYIYSLYGERHVRREFDLATNCGIKCELTRETALPFEVSLAMKVEDQAQFDPMRFICGITHGFDIYENVRVLNLTSNGVACKDGTITAKNVVVATNYPAICDLKGMFPVKLHRKMAHVCTFGNCQRLDGTYIGIDGGYNYRSFGDKLIVSGESHVSGLGSGGAYERIKKNTLIHFKGAKPINHWSAEDSVSLDGISYIGRLNTDNPNVYVATGFGTWGMTTSMTAANLICDLICGRKNETEKLYSPYRLKMDSSADGLTDGVKRAVDGIALSRLRVSDEVSDIPKDYGMIVRHKGRKVAVYRDGNEELHVIGAYCPHKKCELSWNDDDKTWDCRCHGSRFDIDGNLISGPADKGIR